MNGVTQPVEALQKYFGFTSFRGCQQAVIERVLSGQHSLVIMPTGGGKSLCYQIPALIDRPFDDPRPPLTLVISPLIALMKDQVDALRQKGISAAYINSSLSREERDKRYASVRNGKYQLLYVTPERFRKAEFLDVLATRYVSLLAVDEAHCISEWGHDFRPDYTRLEEIREIIGNPTTIALTATATPDVQDDIVDELGLFDDEVQRFHEGIERPNLQIGVRPVWGDDEKVTLIEETVAKFKDAPGSGIIYFTLIKTLERFSDLLRKKRIPHLVYHGDLDRSYRRRVQNDFMQNSCPLVLATPAFGMGIDKEDIRFVLHAEIPGSLESWYQEIGRAGRDGLPADCVLLYDDRDLMIQMEFIQWSNPDPDIYEKIVECLTTDLDKFHSLGLEWLRERLHAGRKHDRRLETALAMLERYGVIEGTWDDLPQLAVVGDLPDDLRSRSRLAEKLKRDQQKLYALVQFAKLEGDRMPFVRKYFGLG